MYQFVPKYFSGTNNCKNLPLLYKNIAWGPGGSVKALCGWRMHFLVGDLLNFDAERGWHTPLSMEGNIVMCCLSLIGKDEQEKTRNQPHALK